MPESTGDIERTHVTEPAMPVPDGFDAGQIVIGKYKVISLLGRGGIGSVYKVEQIFLSQFFALKTLNSQKASDQMIRRFQNEGRTASALNHPNLVKVNDFGLLEGQQPYLVMDFVDGVTLSEYLKQNGLMNLEQVVAMFAQVCLGLSYAHDQGVIHRDIKPSNIMISRTIPFGDEGFVKVVDFGIAKLAYAEDGNFQALTTTGEIFGSPLYMSPEQCSGSTVDHRADIYSLGCVLFEVLAGTTPFVGPNALATMMLHQSERVPTLKEASLGKDFPPELEVLVQKMLAKSPADRYQNLGVVANDLAQIYKGAPVLGLVSAKKKAAMTAAPITISRKKFYLILLGSAACSALIAAPAGFYFGGMSVRNAQSEKVGALNTPLSNAKISVNQTPAKEEQFASTVLTDHALNNDLDDRLDNGEQKEKIEKQFYLVGGGVDKAAQNDAAIFKNALPKLIEMRKEASGNRNLKGLIPEIDKRILMCTIRLNNFSEADAFLERVSSEAKTANEKGDAAGFYGVLGDQAIHANKPADSFRFFKSGAEKFLDASKMPGVDPKYAVLCRSYAGNFLRCCTALSYQALNNIPQAVEIGYQSKALLDSCGDDTAIAEICLTLGSALSRDSQWEKAMAMFRQSEKHWLRVPDPIVAKSLNLHYLYLEMATVYIHFGNNKSALQAVQRARSLVMRYKPKNAAERKMLAEHIKNLNTQIKQLEETKPPA